MSEQGWRNRWKRGCTGWYYGYSADMSQHYAAEPKNGLWYLYHVSSGRRLTAIKTYKNLLGCKRAVAREGLKTRRELEALDLARLLELREIDNARWAEIGAINEEIRRNADAQS